MQVKKYQVIGLMSGSSLDGLDIANCSFEVSLEPEFRVLSWEILQAETITYDMTWKERLEQLVRADARTFAATNVQYGHYIGKIVSDFIASNQLQPDCIASHGHTVFHYPDEQFTTQIGDGAAIAVQTNCKVINDFRAMDLALGGQGAPIASTADKYLFSEYDFMLNIGGIINITARTDDAYVAFDITAANQILNTLSQELGQAFDENGQNAAKGKLIPKLLKKANQLAYLKFDYPKTLDNGWVQTNVLPDFVNWDGATADKLYTACQYIAQSTADAMKQILEKEQLDQTKTYKLLATGGGTLNTFLMDCIEEACQKHLPLQIDLTQKLLIEYKEAALMALMAVMRLEYIPNCLASVTGASKDALGGAIHG